MKTAKETKIVSASPSSKATVKYPPPCKIVDNVVIGDELPLYEERFGIGELLFEKLNSNLDFVGQIDPNTDKRVSFAEIKERSVRCALWLMSRGVKRGDVVGISTYNHLDCVVPLLGCLFIGGCFYPMHFELSTQDCRYFISLVKPKIVFVNADIVETMAQAAKQENLPVELITFGHTPGFQNFQRIIEELDATEVNKFRCTPIANPNEIALLALSSGSTGPSKATMISHRALINGILYDDAFADKNQKVMMWLPPLRWLTGTLFMLRSIFYYKTWIICSKYDVELMLKLVEKYNATWIWISFLTAVRALKYGLFNKYRLSSLKKMVISGTPAKSYLLEVLIKALPHADVLYMYGITELGSATIQRHGDKIGSCGYVMKNVQLKVIDVDTGETLGPSKIGELFWKSPYIMKGYYNNPRDTEETLDEGGWLHSGDLGYYDENGEIYVYGRINDAIRVEGSLVFPVEIENVLESHPAVRESSVVCVRSGINEEYPVAFVSKMPGKEVTAEELVKFVTNKLEGPKRLRGVHFLEELPRTETGKIARKQLTQSAKRFTC